MDHDVNNLLEAWGLSSYKDLFAVNNIDLNSFALLTEDLIKELIGPIGDRARFAKNLKDWNALTNPFEELQHPIQDFKSNVDNLNAQHRAVKDISNLPSTSQTAQEATSLLPLGSIDLTNISAFDIVFNNSTKDNTSLKELLKQTLEGRALIKLYSESGLLSSTGRRKICNIIIKNLLEEDPNKRIHSSVLLDYAEQITSIFRKENISTYFVPYINNSKLKIKRCAKGKLYDCLQNRKREYREVRQVDPENTDVSITNESVSDIIDDLMWLTNSCDPWTLVEKKWKRTAEYRREKLNDSDLTVQKYLDTYPALKKPAGFHLLMSDFKFKYPDKNEKLIENFPLHKSKILDLTVKKYSRHPDNYLKSFTEEYVKLIKENPMIQQETASIYAFMFLPLLLGNPVAKNKKKSWRPSKQEAREAFITHLKAATELQENISRRKEKYAAHGLTFQPTIFIVGPSLTEIQIYYIVVNDTFYTVHSILEAVDVTFKLCYALNCEYPADCINVYYFLQKGFYKITSECDKEYVSVNTLLADLNIE